MIHSMPYPKVIDETQACEKCAFNSGRHAPHCAKYKPAAKKKAPASGK